MYKISLKNNVDFLCSTDDTILSGAQKVSIILNHSCKTGRCQSCKAKVISGTSVASFEETGLNEVDILNGFILTCVRIPTSDLAIDIDDLSAYALESIRTLPAKVDKITPISSTVMELQLRVPPNTSFKYVSGQYVNIIKGDFKRSYSIANANLDAFSNLVFLIKNYNGGKFSNYLFNEAKNNDLLRIEGPIGTFFFRNTPRKNIIFLATGTGIAPVKAILEQLNEKICDVKDKSIYLLFGGRTIEDLFWSPQFINLSISYIPVLSKNSDDWKGAQGYVQNVVMSLGIDLADSVVYACGSENMIRDANTLLIENGLLPDLFYSDAFISS